MPRLILLPETPGTWSGYQKAVASDVNRLQIREHDTVLCYATGNPENLPANFRRLPRPGKLTVQRVTNLLNQRISNELRKLDIERIVFGRSFDELFCGEVTLYRALREMYPGKPITVRFHNFFSVCVWRNQFLRYTLPWQVRLNFALLARLEQEILRDPLVEPIFITEEERQWAQKIYPHRPMHCWEVVNRQVVVREISVSLEKPQLVWFGGLSAHKAYAVQYFVRTIFPQIRTKFPTAEFHLFGSGTARFHQLTNHVFGHGFYSGDGLPLAGKALFINPDLLGGGVKLKLADWVAAGVPFITTPFGAEGYDLPTHENILIAAMDDWANRIVQFFERNLQR